MIWRGVRTVMRKELIQTFRDRRMIAILFLAPVFQTSVFGFAVNLDLEGVPALVADLDRSPLSREVTGLIERAEAFDLRGVESSGERTQEAVERGEAAIVLEIPRGFEERAASENAELLVIQDGSDSNTAVRASQEIALLIGDWIAARQANAAAKLAAGRGVAKERIETKIRLVPRAFFNPALRTAVFLVPGVLAMVLLVITMLLTSMGLTREKEQGTLEQVMVSPLRPMQLILGKTLPFAALGLADVVLVVALAILVFGVPMRGSIPALFGVSGVFLLTTLGLGLFISTVSATQQQAMLNSFFFILPAVMLSGFVFPIEHMPKEVQWLTALNPLRYFIEIVRALMIKGAAIEDFAVSFGALLAIGATVFGLAAARFKKRAT